MKHIIRLIVGVIVFFSCFLFTYGIIKYLGHSLELLARLGIIATLCYYCGFVVARSLRDDEEHY